MSKLKILYVILTLVLTLYAIIHKMSYIKYNFTEYNQIIEYINDMTKNNDIIDDEALNRICDILEQNTKNLNKEFINIQDNKFIPINILLIEKYEPFTGIQRLWRLLNTYTGVHPDIFCEGKIAEYWPNLGKSVLEYYIRYVGVDKYETVIRILNDNIFDNKTMISCDRFGYSLDDITRLPMIIHGPNLVKFIYENYDKNVFIDSDTDIRQCIKNFDGFLSYDNFNIISRIIESLAKCEDTPIHIYLQWVDKYYSLLDTATPSKNVTRSKMVNWYIIFIICNITNIMDLSGISNTSLYKGDLSFTIIARLLHHMKNNKYVSSTFKCHSYKLLSGHLISSVKLGLSCKNTVETIEDYLNDDKKWDGSCIDTSVIEYIKNYISNNMSSITDELSNVVDEDLITIDKKILLNLQTQITELQRQINELINK